jgi:hypothetical protein
VGSSRSPERDLGRIHPNHAVKNDRREPVETSGAEKSLELARAQGWRVVSVKTIGRMCSQTREDQGNRLEASDSMTGREIGLERPHP